MMTVGRVLLLSVITFVLIIPDETEAFWSCAPQACDLSNWSPWSKCSQECGGGTQSRTRTKTTNDGFCGRLTETQDCNKGCSNGGTPQSAGHCSCRPGTTGACCDDCVIFSFEHGISHWNKTGTAFDTQPTYGDNPTARNRGQPANQVGDWWIGTYENRPSPSARPGNVQRDAPTGTLTSPEFQIRGKTLSFLIGGGCNISVVYAELLVCGVSVSKETGSCHETMERRQWDVSAHTGKKARLRLVDGGSGGWEHINFDHLVNRNF